MSGNVSEWCMDLYDRNAHIGYKGGNLTTPSSGGARVLHGGSWDPSEGGGYCRCAVRNNRPPAFRTDFIGFRCALTV
jgi:formylglycine-generating enzyme required for sulfatase activity